MPADIEIWSGGQTGVDRAALDVAIELSLPYGGWVPRGRMAEDGPLPDRYTGMRETESARLDVRTRRNVRESDATLIITFGDPTGGTALTLDTAEAHERPVKVLDLRALREGEAVADARRWLASLPRPLRLNVAGPRASTTPEAYEGARNLLAQVLCPKTSTGLARKVMQNRAMQGDPNPRTASGRWKSSDAHRSPARILQGKVGLITIYEREPVPEEAVERALVFESADFTIALADFPPDWHRMTDDQLAALIRS